MHTMDPTMTTLMIPLPPNPLPPIPTLVHACHSTNTTFCITMLSDSNPAPSEDHATACTISSTQLCKLESTLCSICCNPLSTPFHLKKQRSLYPFTPHYFHHPLTTPIPDPAGALSTPTPAPLVAGIISGLNSDTDSAPGPTPPVAANPSYAAVTSSTP
jgi:hypothetical protein